MTQSDHDSSKPPGTRWHAPAAWPPVEWTAVLAAVLVVTVYLAGSEGLDSPWIQGDEFIFIVRNGDVNPAEPGGGGPARGLLDRCGAILTKVHDDLYQPIPILTYALQWSLTGGEPVHFRRADLFLHALNALLTWWVLASVLRRFGGTGPVGVVAWALASVWALHPLQVSTYAADMGRTHLLSATFSLLAVGLYLQAVGGGGARWSIAAVAALALAMLCKPVPGWFAIAAVLEASRGGGWRPAVRSRRLWAVALLCFAFGAFAVLTTREAGILDDVSGRLFGDPVTRSGLAAWLYFRNVAAPAWLAFWYLSDPRTGWTYPLVWVGWLLAAASAAHALRAWRDPQRRAVTLGWVWCWGLLLPVLGIIGAREVAAVDRYLYQPLAGLLLVVGAVVLRAARHRPPRAVAVAAVLTAFVVGLPMVVLARPYGQAARSTFRRAAQAVRCNPGDPRALEALAAAYDFSRNHPLPASEQAAMPPDISQFQHFNELFVDTLGRAASVPNLASYFPTPADQAAFHRWVSYRFLTAGRADKSLEQAEAARTLRPDDYMTWKRLAHAYQALGRLEEAAEAYSQGEARLPHDPRVRAIHFTDYGNLLLFDLERDAEACPRFAAAYATGYPPDEAKMGMALCMIRDSRVGTGSEGFGLISEVLRADPGNVRAGLVLAEYHLRSHHWREAWLVYDALIRDNPTQYTALRGYHEVCLQVDRPHEAALAWADALAAAPGRREFESYMVWALALAGDTEAGPRAEGLLASDPDNPLACLALMLLDTRQGELERAVERVVQAGHGRPVPKAREFERAAASVAVLIGRGQLPAEAVLVQAALYAYGEFPAGLRQRGLELVRGHLVEHPDSRHVGLAHELERRLSDVKEQP